jgi:hypothetical protein
LPLNFLVLRRTFVGDATQWRSKATNFRGTQHPAPDLGQGTARFRGRLSNQELDILPRFFSFLSPDTFIRVRFSRSIKFQVSRKTHPSADFRHKLYKTYALIFAPSTPRPSLHPIYASPNSRSASRCARTSG